MDKKRVVITGLGAVTPLGNTRERFWEALVEGRSGVGPIQAFDPHQLSCHIAAEVKGFDPDASIGRRDARRMDRFAQFAFVAATEALADARFPEDAEVRDNTGIVVASGIGGILTLQNTVSAAREAKQVGRISPFFIPMLMGNAASAQISMQHKLAADLAAEHARLNAVQSVANIGSWSLDILSGDYEWSEQTHRICGTDPHHFVPTTKTMVSVIHPDDRATLQAALIRSLKVAEPQYAIEHRILLKSGIERVVDSRWQISRDDTGRAIVAVGTCQDITPRRQAERALRENQSLLAMSGRLALVDAWSVELPPTRVTWSETVALIHDMPVGATPTVDEAFAFYAPEHTELIKAAFARCIEEGEPFDVEYEIITATSRRVLVRAIGEAVRDGNGVICRVQGTSGPDGAPGDRAEGRTSRRQARKHARDHLGRLLHARPRVALHVSQPACPAHPAEEPRGHDRSGDLGRLPGSPRHRVRSAISQRDGRRCRDQR